MIMMMSVTLVLVALLSMSSTGQSSLVGGISLPDISSLPSGNVNEQIDFLLQNFKETLPSRIDLENVDVKYADDCFLTGLRNEIKRHGDAVLDIKDKKAVFSFGLSTGRITMECKWKKKILFIKFNGTVKAYTNKVSIRARLSLDLYPGKHPLLEEFKVTHLDKIKSDVSGAGIFNWIAEKLLNRKVNGAKEMMIRELERTASKRLQSSLERLKIPSF